MEIQSDREYHRKALALLVCFFIAFMYVETIARPYYAPKQATSPAGQQATQQSQTSPGLAPTAVQAPQAVSATGAVAPAQSTPGAVSLDGYPQDAQIAERGFVIVKTNKMTARVSLLGGRLTELRLREYKETIDENAVGLNMIHHGGQAPYPLGIYAGMKSNDMWTVYSAAGATPGVETVIDLTSGNKLEQQVELTGTLPDGRTITKTVTFGIDEFFIGVSAKLSAPDAGGKPITLEWSQFVGEHDSSLLDMYNVPGFVWFDGQKAVRKPIKDLAPQTQDLGPVSWISVGDKYFATVLISPVKATNGQLVRLPDEQIYRTHLEGTVDSGEFKIFTGPKSYRMLKTLGFDLQRVIEFGTFGVVAEPLLRLLYLLHWFLGNYGLAIVALTILVKLALYPLNAASYKQMKAMQDLKPEMDRIREQFKDKQEQQMQLMGLYKKHGVNPVGGCLPVLLQMPIFIGLYSGLMLAVELRHAHFGLWIHDLSAPEKLMMGGIAIPVMVILFVASMIIQQATTPSQMDPAQKKMMMVMPLFLGFMFAKFPSGLTLYWLTSNLISIGQQKGLQRVHNDGKSGLIITLTVSVAVFVLAWVVTLL